MKRLLDINICIYLIKQKSPGILQKFRQYQPGDIGVSTITVAELQFGVQNSQYKTRNAQALEQFLLPLAIADFDWAATIAYGQLRAALEQAGQPIGSLDMLIAAHALSLDVTLVTNNTREFARVPGLSLENWVEG